MTIISSDDIVIEIDGVDYSNYIDSYSESGGERQFKLMKHYGNNYKRIETGRSDFSVEFNFRMDEIDLNALFEITTPITIEITDITNSQQTITYTNMLPTTLKPDQQINELLSATLKYSAPAYTDSVLNREITA